MRICGCIQDIDVCHILCTCKYVECDRIGRVREREREKKKWLKKKENESERAKEING